MKYTVVFYWKKLVEVEIEADSDEELEEKVAVAAGAVDVDNEGEYVDDSFNQVVYDADYNEVSRTD